tara:strand:- start:218 stop:895 length:678 start_codon:yes stop_codon:yes gene_type:complete
MSYILLILSVLLGYVIVLITKPNTKIVRLLLAFSGAYLLSVTILHLLPEVYTNDSDKTVSGIFILLGITLQSVLESFSKGAEHGHIHNDSKTKKVPILLFLSLSIHAFSEGLPIHNANENLLWAIMIHKIPVAIVLTSFFIGCSYPKNKTLLLIVIFALMSPLGVLFADRIPFFNNNATAITALIIGVFLHISTVILFESSENHKFNIQKFTAIILGLLLTIFTL